MRQRASFSAALFLVAIGSVPASAEFREQTNFRFRDPSELNAALAREQARLQANGLTNGGVLAGSSRGASAAQGLGAGAGMTSSSATIGNMTTGTATVTVNGSKNVIMLDGFLNVTPSQTNSGQTSNVDTSINGAD